MVKKETSSKLSNLQKLVITIVIIGLTVLTILTNYHGSTDIGDYSDTAKYFADLQSSKIRNSHSYLYGFMLYPFVKLTSNFIFFKIVSLISLFLIIYLTYIFNNKSKKTFFLLLFSPIVWYMAPWINPLQLAGLFLLISYHNMVLYNDKKNLKNLLYSGVSLGLGWAIWDTILFFGIFLIICFLLNKKVNHLIYFLIAVLIGLSPRLILDQVLFGFPFYTILKSSFGTLANIFGGIYQRSSGHGRIDFLTLILLFVTIPFYYWSYYSPKKIKENMPSITFISLCILLILFNPQLRYMIVIVPIIILLIGKTIPVGAVKLQLVFSLIILLIFIFPYFLQINSSISKNFYGDDIDSTIRNFQNLDPNSKNIQLSLKEDLEEIIKDHPNNIFLVGNNPDDFQLLAQLYWGDNVKEFVSIQDYKIIQGGSSTIFEKTFMPTPKIKTRRQIWIKGGISKNMNDNVDYENIQYAIGLYSQIDLPEYEFKKRYGNFYLSTKK
jgi:hypothetical protein